MKIADLQVLLKVAELQSITAAANQLDMSSSAASVSLKRIEQALGAQIFVRTTRQIRLTPEGERYLPLCQQALDLLQQGQVLIHEEQQSISGEVRIAVSSEMGRNLMRVLLNNIMDKHSEVTLRLQASDSRADFYRDGIDVALRALTKEAAQELNLYGFKICNIAHVLCASPDYIKKHGEPLTPDDLLNHNALLYKLYEVVHDGWELYNDNQKYKVKMSSDRAVNDGDIVRRWCVDGTGIAKKSAIDVAEDLLAGRLKRLMPDYKIPLTEMWLVLPSRQLITPAIRLIRDELKHTISQLRKNLIAQGIINEQEWPDSP
ncbi:MULTISPECIES: LysR family transcriptional regulator [Pseudoalteromonas]|jgi:DNA-binding transcriptional LysR family regulator|uniref:LysR family transcriptional regulator n=1 Tax=Pseudoalteromonas TaxID=53246 RepID=UPI002118CB59|nr:MULTISPECIES: LysR family transcriptional regulator [Pseudoalteromonas]MDC9520414.1 LysR family transcriptional regulator [Pseudoalteromonas sp. Angola-31]MDY6887322.1 LysR family transcriptional regulator [Pseudomonadota bacterium]MCQ8821215.1 LysR family transcriptional regulator [Pseudoalteromonas agarivorans]MDC9510035.1 LysR family transcriptional regulator [Pseudoalteromonas sp. Angola-4]MDC9527382.1 LysR family transcriptional regulator [Pseudoalteromonas sp. Angola-30]